MRNCDRHVATCWYQLFLQASPTYLLVSSQKQESNFPASTADGYHFKMCLPTLLALFHKQSMPCGSWGALPASLWTDETGLHPSGHLLTTGAEFSPSSFGSTSRHLFFFLLLLWKARILFLLWIWIFLARSSLFHSRISPNSSYLQRPWRFR